MYSKVTIDDVEQRDLEGIEPSLRAIGYETRPEEMRPSVWEFEEAEENNRHYHEAQEELYLVLEGRFHMAVGEEGFELEEGDVVVVEPSAERQVTALETPSRLFVVGAPNEADDAVVVD